MYGQKEINKLQVAYDFFNRAMFNGECPDVFLTVQRKRGANGYFWTNIMQSRDGGEAVSELAMNPSTFGRTDMEILSTLAHEMVHAWQWKHGEPGSNGYHNKEWAEKMKTIGLQPVSFDRPGKETGRSCSHEIIEGGLFDEVASVFVQRTKLGFASADGDDGSMAALLKLLGGKAGVELKKKKTRKRKSVKSKTKFTCPTCEQNAWAKPSARLICGDCHESTGEIVSMVAQD